MLKRYDTDNIIMAWRYSLARLEQDIFYICQAYRLKRPPSRDRVRAYRANLRRVVETELELTVRGVTVRRGHEA